jgi:large subunit ribosomal protein L18
MSHTRKIQKRAERRVHRVRNALRTSAKPRVCVFRSNKHISAQLIDDVQGKTLAAVSSLSLKATSNNKEVAHKVGLELGKRALELSVSEVKFDRGRYLYHGRVCALAQGLRESGLSL